MELARHTATLGDSFIGAGKMPVLIPFHQVVLQTGIIGGIGGIALGSPMICGKRKKTSSDMVVLSFGTCQKVRKDESRVNRDIPHRWFLWWCLANHSEKNRYDPSSFPIKSGFSKPRPKLVIVVNFLKFKPVCWRTQ